MPLNRKSAEIKTQTMTSVQGVDIMAFGVVLLSVVSILVLIMSRIMSGM